MLIIENICSAWKHSERVRQPYMELHCYAILMILINIPLPTSKRKPSHQNQVQHLLSASCVPAWQNPSPATCSTLESLFQSSLSLVPQGKHSAEAELFYTGWEPLAQKSIQARLPGLVWPRSVPPFPAALSQGQVPATALPPGLISHQPNAGLGPLRKIFKFPIPKIAQTSLNIHRHWYCPLIAPIKVKAVFPL